VWVLRSGTSFYGVDKCLVFFVIKLIGHVTVTLFCDMESMVCIALYEHMVQSMLCSLMVTAVHVPFCLESDISDNDLCKISNVPSHAFSEEVHAYIWANFFLSDAVD
jgi:hypothetical protein